MQNTTNVHREIGVVCGQKGKSMSSIVERRCRERGLKMTGQRKTIAQVLSNARDHPDVEELYRRASNLDPKMSIATVYRTVRLFEENGILEKRDFGGGRARYEPSRDGEGHHHIIDVDNGKVIEFSNSALDSLICQITATMGLKLISFRMQIYGRAEIDCPDSQDSPANW